MSKIFKIKGRIKLSEIQNETLSDIDSKIKSFWVGELNFKFVGMDTEFGEPCFCFSSGSKYKNAFSKYPYREVKVVVDSEYIICKEYVNLSGRNLSGDDDPDALIAHNEIGAFFDYLRTNTYNKESFANLEKYRKHVFKWYIISLIIMVSIISILKGGIKLYYAKAKANEDAQYLQEFEKQKNELPDVDVYLIPVFGFSEAATSDWAKILSNDLKLKVKAVPSMAREDLSFNLARNQMPANVYHNRLLDINKTLKSKNPKCVYVAITVDALYLEGENFNFVYTTYFDDKNSILGLIPLTAGLVPNSSKSEEILQKRAIKMLKRCIGRTYYGYPPSSNPNSVMKSPIICIDDVDNIGNSF